MGQNVALLIWSARVSSPDKVRWQSPAESKKNEKSTRRAEVSPTAAAAVNRRFPLDAHWQLFAISNTSTSVRWQTDSTSTAGEDEMMSAIARESRIFGGNAMLIQFQSKATGDGRIGSFDHG